MTHGFPKVACFRELRHGRRVAGGTPDQPDVTGTVVPSPEIGGVWVTTDPNPFSAEAMYRFVGPAVADYWIRVALEDIFPDNWSEVLDRHRVQLRACRDRTEVRELCEAIKGTRR